MAPFRIPFTSKKSSVANTSDPSNNENQRPAAHGSDFTGPYRDKPSLALAMKEKNDEPNEFKLSSVNDSGEYLPPSPIEKKSFWHKSPTSSTTTPRSTINDNEPFSISRESFDSYRRSFDISGRSPIIQSDSFTSRSSLDSRSFRLPPRASVNQSTFDKPPTADAGFEDVKLTEEQKQQPKKKSFLSRFGDSSNDGTSTNSESTKSHHFHLPGRKRGQSGTGDELGEMKRPESQGKTEVVVR